MIKGNGYPVFNGQPRTYRQKLSSFLRMKISDFGTKKFYPLGGLQPYKFSRRVSPLHANRISALLKVKNHASVSQQKFSGRIKPFPACLGAPAGDLDGLMNPLASTSSIAVY